MKSDSGDCRSGLPKTSMRPLLALVALWAALDACLAEEDVVSRHGSNSSNAHAAELSSEKQKEAFSKELCGATVKKVQETGKYTEESIVPICNEIMKSPKCDFFAEALSLASSHSDFDSKRFCLNMDEAHFCSDVMDKLLMSTPVSDLAFGECERAQKTPDEARCRKMKMMLTYAVQNEDLDTLRACYMLEAFTNLTTSQELKDNEKSTNVRIIATSSKELEDAGKGRNIAYNPNMGNPDIVLQPVPLEQMGKGKGNLTVENFSTAPATAALNGSTGSSIIVEPIPAGGKTSAALAPTAAAAPAAAVAAASPAAAAASPAAATPIIAVPKPVQAAVVTGTVTTRTVVAPTPAPGAVLLHARKSTAVSAVPARIVKQQSPAAHSPPASVPAKLIPAAAAGNADQSLVPKITAVQLENSTKVVVRPVAMQNGTTISPRVPANTSVSEANGTSVAPKPMPADHSKLAQLSTQKATTVPSAQTSVPAAHAAPNSDATGPRPALRSTTLPPASPGKGAPAAVASRAAVAVAAAPVASQALSNATASNGSSRSVSGAAHRRTGLAQARLVAQAHHKEHHKEEARKEAKGDYNGFLSKFVAA